MPILHLIAHKIEKPGPSAHAAVSLSETELQLTGVNEEFGRELRQSFIKKLGKAFGRFAEEPSNLIAPWLKEYLDEKMGFAPLTHRLAKHFGQLLDGTECAVYGYLVTTLEQQEAAQIFSMFWVETKGVQFFDGELQLNDMQVLDSAGLTLAVKVNLSEWLQGESTSYVGVLPRRGDKDLTDVFTELVGFTDKRDIKAETEQFLHAVETFVVDMPEDKGIETRAKVVEFCLEQGKSGDNVDMQELSQFVSDDNPTHFKQYIAKECPQLEQSIIPDKSQLRNYMRISGRNELMSMSFASDCLGQSVIYDGETDSLIIKTIPPALKQRLQKHLAARKFGE